jgi:hypothetical protein
LYNESSSSATSLGVAKFIGMITINFVTLKAAAKLKLLLNKQAFQACLSAKVATKAGLLNKSLISAAALGVTKFIVTIFINLVTPKAAAKHEFLFNKQAFQAYLSAKVAAEASLLNESSSVTKLVPLIVINLVTPKAATTLELLFKKLAFEAYLSAKVSTAASLFNKSSSSSVALGVTKFIVTILINLVTPKAAAKHEFLFSKEALSAELTTGASLFNKS